MSHNYIYGSFSRLSDFPLDDRYLFETREKLNSYLTVSGRMTTTAYEGQLVYIIDEEALCLVQKDEQGGFYPQTITSEAYDDADIRNEIDQIKDIIANGKYNVTETDGGVAYGIGTIARHHQFAVGEYNKEDPNAIFSVGNGEPANRNNALTVNRDGTVTLSSDPKKDNDAVTKKYVDDAVSNVTVDLSGYATSEDLKQATENLIDDTKLNESIKDFVTKEEVPSLVDTSNLVTEDELKAAIDGISGSEVTAEEFNNLSEKVNTIDDDIDGIIEDIKKQSENILSLDDRIIELENNPAVPENVVDEDRLSEVLSSYATKNDIASILTKKLVDSVDIENNKIHIGDSESDPVENVIYLVKNIDAALPDIYNEYLVLDGALTLIGDTSTDLNDYYDKNDIDSIINNKANKVHKHTLSDISDYIAPKIPTKVSELENDSKFITEDDIDLSNYYTKEEVDDLINNSGDVTIPITPIVLDDSVTENSSNGVKSSGIYAFVKDEISKIEHPEQNTPNLEGYATEKYVQDEIAKIEIPEVPSLDGYATKEYVSNEISNLDIPNLEGYATQEWVEEQSFLKELPSHTHDEYLTENDIHDSVEKLNKLKDDFDSHMEVVGNFFGESDVATKHDQLVEIKKAIDDLHDQVIDGNIAGALVDRVLEIEKTRYTKTEVDDLLEEKSDVGHTHDEYTTEDWVKEQGYLTDLPTHNHDDVYSKLDHNHDGVYLKELPEHSHEEYLTSADVDNSLSDTSTNPVQNKVVKTAIDAKLDSSTFTTFVNGETGTLTDIISAKIAEAELKGEDDTVDLSIYAKQTDLEALDSREANRLVNSVINDDGSYSINITTSNSSLLDAIKNKKTGMFTTFVKTGMAIDAPTNDSDYRGISMIDDWREEVVSEETGESVVKYNGWIILISADNHPYTRIIVDGVATDWKQLDKEYELESIDPLLVKTTQEYKTTTGVGTIKSTGTPVTFLKKGDTLHTFFNLFMEKLEPSISRPSISNFKITNAGAKEVGTNITPNFSYTFNSGSYGYNTVEDNTSTATGITISSASLTGKNNNTAISGQTSSVTTTSGSMPSLKITDGMSYTIHLSLVHTEGRTPLYNTGEEYADGKIDSATITAKTSNIISSCRYMFTLFPNEYNNETGELNRVTISNVRSEMTKTSNTSKNKSISIPVNATRVLIAYPSSWGTIKKIVDSATGYDIVTAFTYSTIDVADLNATLSSDKCQYYLYSQELAKPLDAATTYTIS